MPIRPAGRVYQKDLIDLSPGGLSKICGDPLLNVVCALACPKLDDSNIGEPLNAKWILTDDPLELFAIVRDRKDDPTVPWDLSS